MKMREAENESMAELEGAGIIVSEQCPLLHHVRVQLY